MLIKRTTHLTATPCHWNSSLQSLSPTHHRNPYAWIEIYVFPSGTAWAGPFYSRSLSLPSWTQHPPRPLCLAQASLTSWTVLALLLATCPSFNTQLQVHSKNSKWQPLVSLVMAASSHQFLFGWPFGLKSQATHPGVRLHVILHAFFTVSCKWTSMYYMIHSPNIIEYLLCSGCSFGSMNKAMKKTKPPSNHRA